MVSEPDQLHWLPLSIAPHRAVQTGDHSAPSSRRSRAQRCRLRKALRIFSAGVAYRATIPPPPGLVGVDEVETTVRQCSASVDRDVSSTAVNEETSEVIYLPKGSATVLEPQYVLFLPWWITTM